MASDPEYARFFPYEEPYDHQREAIEGIADEPVENIAGLERNGARLSRRREDTFDPLKIV